MLFRSEIFPSVSKEVVKLSKSFKYKNILLLGTGEFMHYPLVASSFIHSSNCIKIQSTTRSPIQIGGDIRSKIIFRDNYSPSEINYLYNVIDRKYDVIIIFYEAKSKYDHLLVDQLNSKFKKVISIYL